MEHQDKISREVEAIRIIAIEEFRQSNYMSFKAMLDLFYMKTALPSKDVDRSIQDSHKAYPAS